uniref:CSON005901 protein n=1 Tax=Culicoides sonorensis TaxID=179676 RepID=A0A336MWF4_CULSO
MRKLQFYMNFTFPMERNLIIFQSNQRDPITCACSNTALVRGHQGPCSSPSGVCDQSDQIMYKICQNIELN